MSKTHKTQLMDTGAKKNLVVRTLSGILLAVIVIGAALAGRYAFDILLTIVGIIASFEFLRLLGKLKVQLYLTIPLVIISVVLPLALLMYLYVYVGAWQVVWYIFIIWMNDIGAYLVGVTLGRRKGFDRKLCPSVSPLKTWTGFFGGVLFGVGTGILAAVIMGWNVWFWMGLAIVAVITGVAGDLTESKLKRAAGVKDSGKLLPGHGGMLDRFDALLFSAPFVFIYFLIFA